MEIVVFAGAMSGDDFFDVAQLTTSIPLYPAKTQEFTLDRFVGNWLFMVSDKLETGSWTKDEPLVVKTIKMATSVGSSVRNTVILFQTAGSDCVSNLNALMWSPL